MASALTPDVNSKLPDEEKVNKTKENKTDANMNIRGAEKDGTRTIGGNRGLSVRNLNEERRLAWEEEQAKKVVLETGVKGKVKWYSVRYHYGFIARIDGKESDVFVHQTAISKSRIIKYYLRTLDDGEEVLFDIVEGKKGPEAANVTGPDGTEVRGSRFHNMQFYPYRRRFPFYGDRFTDYRWIAQGRRRYQDERRVAEPKKSDIREDHDNKGETKQPRSGRPRRFRNFRARRQQVANTKVEGNEAAGDIKKEDRQNGTETDHRGDARRRNNRRSRRRSQGLDDGKSDPAKEEKLEKKEEKPAVKDEKIKQEVEKEVDADGVSK